MEQIENENLDQQWILYDLQSEAICYISRLKMKTKSCNNIFRKQLIHSKTDYRE